MNNVDLENDWLRMDVATPSTYYGYAHSPSTSEGTNSWAIRKITASGSVTTVSWNDNVSLLYNASWTNRYNCFLSPTASLGLTWSSSTSTNSFGISSTVVSFSWNGLSGVDNYTITISDQNGVVYNYLNQAFTNTYIYPLITNQQSTTTYKFSGVPSMTYSVRLTAINQAGSTSSTATVTT